MVSFIFSVVSVVHGEIYQTLLVEGVPTTYVRKYCMIYRWIFAIKDRGGMFGKQ